MSFSRNSLFARFRPLLWAMPIVFGLALIYHATAAPVHMASGHPVSVVQAQVRRTQGRPTDLHHAVPDGRAAPHAAPSLPFILHSFDLATSTGASPDGGPLVYVPTLGLIYGTTTKSSSSDGVTTGTVFSLDPIPNGQVTTLLATPALLNNGLALGYDSSSRMILYGTDLEATTGTGLTGGIFSVNPIGSSTEAQVRDFNQGAAPYPFDPQAGLVAGPDGYLYGTTRYESNSAVAGTQTEATSGILYRFLPSAPSATFEVLHRFAADGSEGHPMKGALPLVSSSGALYGVTTTSSVVYNVAGVGGNDPGVGHIYRYDPGVSDSAQRFQILTRLDPSVVGNLTKSQSGLAQGSDGLLYGTTDVGPATGNGTVYRFNPADSSVSVQYAFGQTQTGGGTPIAGLIVGADHNLYGTTTKGVDTANNFAAYPGSVFRLRPDTGGNYSQIDVLHQFAAYDNNDNAPEGTCDDPMVEVNGILFGTSYSGGSKNDGLIFQVDDGDGVPPAPPPTITKLTYHVHDDGTSEVDVTGTNFVSAPAADITNTNEAGLTVTFGGATGVTLNLPRTVAAGDHTVTITNPDKQSAKATLTTVGAPLILTPSTAVTDTDGTVHLIVSGFNFAKPGYDADPTGSLVVVQAVDAQGNASNVDTAIARGPDAPAGKTGPQQFLVTLNSTDAGSFTAYDHYNVEVFNADGQHSPLPGQPGAHTAHGAHPHADSQTAANFLVFDQSQTQYHFQLILPPNLLGDCNGLLASENAQIAAFNAHASPTQLLLGNLSLLSQYPAINIAAQGIGSTVTGLVSNSSGTLISQDGNGLVSNSSGTVISNDGGSLVSNSSGTLISQYGSNLISQDGNGLVSNSSGTLVSNSSGTLVPVSALVGDIQASAGLNGNLHVTGIVAQGGGNIVPHTAATPHDASNPALSFDMTRHDEGTTHGAGTTEATFVAEFTNGTSELVLDIRYTPGQPDIVEYMAPGVTLTPTNGTPAPQVINPVPTLTTVSPNGVTAGSGDTTITATGTLFTTGSVLHWNGQALTTTVVTGTQLSAVVPAALIAHAGAAQVTVTNPAPGGGASGAVSVTISPATPPTTTATVTGPQNSAGAYTAPPIVTLTAAAGSFPVASTTYAVDGGAAQAYTAPFKITTAGAHTVAYFSADTVGNTESAKTLTLTVQPILHVYPAGLQMFAVPADFTGVPLGAALAPPPARVVTWDPGALQYADAASLAPGRGYWARFAQDTALYALGTPTDPSKPFGIALKHGWNMIGDPFPSPVSLTAVRVQDAAGKGYTFSDASKAGLIAYAVYGYPAGSTRYQAQDGSGSLSPYQGYWLYAFQGCTLEVSAP